MNRKIGVGLYGNNGHQVASLLENCPWGEVVAFAQIEPAPPWIKQNPLAVRHGTLAELLSDPRVELVSLCSPRRADQFADAMASLQAGRHVYAEKPAALSEDALDTLLAAARTAGREFHEMADTVFRQPFHAARDIVRAGRLGDIVQVWAQKSYRSGFDFRPQDEEVDGGLIRQCAIHAVRMVEHVTGIRVQTVQAAETQLGNPRQGGLHTASSLLLTLENGGVGAIIANYLNPDGFGRHGNDQVRFFGTKGTLELVDDVRRSRLIIGADDLGPIDASAAVEPYLHSYLKRLLDLGEMPMSLEEELHPLRVVNRAKLNAEQASSSVSSS